MSNRVFTFSVKPTDQAKLDLIQRLREECRAKGVSFSHVCTEALLLYVEKTKEVK